MTPLTDQARAVSDALQDATLTMLDLLQPDVFESDHAPKLFVMRFARAHVSRLSHVDEVVEAPLELVEQLVRRVHRRHGETSCHRERCLGEQSEPARTLQATRDKGAGRLQRQ